MVVLENPYSAQNINRNLRFQGLTTGSAGLLAWETHLQDTPPSPLALIHTENVSFLLFLHTVILPAQMVVLFAKNAASAKIPAGTNMTSDITSLFS